MREATSKQMSYIIYLSGKKGFGDGWRNAARECLGCCQSVKKISIEQASELIEDLLAMSDAGWRERLDNPEME